MQLSPFPPELGSVLMKARLLGAMNCERGCIIFTCGRYEDTLLYVEFIIIIIIIIIILLLLLLLFTTIC